MKVVKAKPEDAVIIGAIHSEAWKQAYEKIFPAQYLETDTAEKRKKEYIDSLEDENIAYFLIYHDKPIGIIKIFNSQRFCEILSIYLLKQYWNKGFGTQALQHILKLYDTKEVCLWTLKDNVNAQKFYVKNGFYITEERRTIHRGKEFVQIKLEYGKYLNEM